MIACAPCVGIAPAGGLPPAEALRRMKPAPGFTVDLVASEPDVRQPVTMSFDDRGRLWVIQYLQYPNPAGLKAVKTDRYLRTTYDRAPEPPPRGPRGVDRITICEDANGDGRMDKFKDFVGGLNLASGMALAPDGVYVAQAPYLLFYPDRNRDDVPDGDPEVLLSGFGMEDAHAVVNSLVWGPGGWLYGAQGSTVTAHIRGITFQQGVWRYHPQSKRFELFAEGGGNTWGVDFDRHGNLFAGTNWGGYAMLHMVQGGYYVKGFEKHGPLQNPHAYGYFHHVPYKNFRGGHVTCGGIVYQGGAFPRELDGAYIAGNLLSNAIHWHRLIPDRSTFRAEFGGELLSTDDMCFRPIDCMVGPDGAVYVADWYDKRANHVDPVDDWDKTSGRIYRIRAVGLPTAKVHPPTNEDEASRTIQFVRRLGDDGAVGGQELDTLNRLAATAAQPALRCQLACSARRLSAAAAMSIVQALLAHDEDADDPFIPLLLWWAIEAKADQNRAAVMSLFAEEAGRKGRVLREHLLGRLARRLAAVGKPHDWADCARLFEWFQGQEDTAKLLSGIDLGSMGRKFQAIPAELATAYDAAARRHAGESAVIRLNVRFQAPGSLDTALQRLAAPTTAAADQAAIISEIAALGTAHARQKLLAAWTACQNAGLAKSLVTALERFDDLEIPQQWLGQYAHRSQVERTQIVASLLVRSTWAALLLDAVDAGTVPVAAIDDGALQKLASYADAAISRRMEARWGKVKPPSPGEVRARIHGVCVTVRMAKGDSLNGQRLFKEHCAICHKMYGEGNAVGPELTGLDRKNLEFLVSNVVEPSAVIRKEFTSHILATTDGRVLTGLLAEQSMDAVTLLDAKNQRVVVPRSEIESLRASDVSLMPEKLLDKLDHQQIRDLFAYLQADRR